MTSPTLPSSRPMLHAAGDGRRDFGLLLDHGPFAPATARHQARPVLTSWGLDEEQIYDTLLVISELVTNAVTHALPPVVLHLHAGADNCGRIQIHVSDGGPQTDPASWAAARPSDEHGRGAAIISALTDGTGAAPDGDGLIDRWADLDAA
ncbi:ATP-binding protein (plasmid) [Streptomyces sp. NBC_00289]|uniref:ATP-binding protein n=1 Tax=Streptomyces sp. NBC_00289 TaxID=2975703 RepID=UPI003253C46E